MQLATRLFLALGCLALGCGDASDTSPSERPDASSGTADAFPTPVDATMADASLPPVDAGLPATTDLCSSSLECDDGDTCTSDVCESGVCIRYSDLLCDWPAEAGDDATNLTGIEGPLLNDFHTNLSGAVWNPVSNTLWLVKNRPGTIWAVHQNGDNYAIGEVGGDRAEWDIPGDIEGITQADFGETNTVYVLNEAGSLIQEYELSSGDAILANSWPLTATMGGDTAEGITFVPDSFLSEQDFRDDQGQPYTSNGGMGGLFFVARQLDGDVFVFDLNRVSGEHSFVGRYSTGASESAGLEFDRSTGQLYIWHDDDFDQLEVARLDSEAGIGRRALRVLLTYSGPELGLFMSSNLEGIAIAPVQDCEGGVRPLWLVIDGGDFWSLLMFREFPC